MVLGLLPMMVERRLCLFRVHGDSSFRVVGGGGGDRGEIEVSLCS